jgi:hypothetical protein
MSDIDAASATYTRIARQIVRDGARVIGFIAVTDKRRPVPLTPLIERLAVAITGFVAQDIAFIPGWKEWKPMPELSVGAGEDAGRRMSVREVRTRVVEVMPSAAVDAPSAAAAVDHALKVLPEDFAHVLVNLDGHASAGGVPISLGLVEAVAIVATTRAARLNDVRMLAEHIPASKQLGAILVG